VATQLEPAADFEAFQRQLLSSFRTENCVYAVWITGERLPCAPNAFDGLVLTCACGGPTAGGPPPPPPRPHHSEAVGLPAGQVLTLAHPTFLQPNPLPKQGRFPSIRVRAVCKQPDGTPLVEAAAKQLVFDLKEDQGDLVGAE
jgi:hypothetical protein